MNRQIFKIWNWPKKFKILVVLLFILVTVFIIFIYANKNSSPIPKDIEKQLSFSPLVLPEKTKRFYASDYKYDTAENKLNILTYVVYLENNSITISQYPKPPEFDEISEYKESFLTNVINQNSTVSTSNGTIYLGKAVKQNNKQLAIMVDRGLLVFMIPEKELSSDDWRSLGDQLEIQKISN